MKENTQLISVILFFIFINISAQIDCSKTKFTVADFIAAKQEINFTAYLKDDDANVYFIVNDYIKETYTEEDVIWEFGGGNQTASGYEVAYNTPSPGNLKVTLRINQQGQDDVLTKEDNTFILSPYGGLKIRYVKEFEWPNGNVYGVHAPYTHRILNGSINAPDNEKYDYHRALDIISPLGGDIIAPANGVIDRISNPDTGAKSVRIKHMMDTPMYIHGEVVYNYYTSSLHVESINPNIISDDDDEAVVVCKGQKICEVGASGLNGYFHNHFSVYVGTSYSQGFLERNPGIINNERNEFSKSVDARINPYLFLDNAINENNTLRYSVEENDDILRVTVNSDFLEDHFNEISVRYSMTSGEKKELKLNLSTREGLPSFGNSDERYDYCNDDANLGLTETDIEAGITEYVPDPNVSILPQNFGRSESQDVTGNNLTGTNRVKDYQTIFEFKNFDSFNTDSGDYIKVKDFYGNLGTKVDEILINYEDFDSGVYDFWTLSPLSNNNEASEFDNSSESNPRSLHSLKSIALRNKGSIKTTHAIAVSEYDRVQIKFSYYNPSIDNGFDNGHNILLQYSSDDEASWTTLKNIVYDPSNVIFNEKDFWYTYTGYIDNVSNLETIKVRIIGDNSRNGIDKRILIDYVSLAGFSGDFSQVFLTNGTEDIKTGNILYPNPVENTLFISSNLWYKNFIIYDLLGQQVKSGNIINNSIDVSYLDKSIYIVHLTKDDGSIANIKIIKK